MVIAGTTGDAVDMRNWTVMSPGDLTRDRYDRLLADRLHRELTLLTMIKRPEICDRVRDADQECEELADNPELIYALEEEALLERRIMLLHLAWSQQRARG
jgi:transcription elongation factor-like protein